MGTILASTIIDKARILIHDAAKVRWPDVEMLGWLNDGQREVVILKPTANVKNLSVTMVAGTKQSIPADGVVFIAVKRNMGVGGASPGNIVTRVDGWLLDETIPGWHYDPESSTAIHYIFDENDPKTYHLYPPQPATPASMELVYAYNPIDIAAETVPIHLDDIYQNALINYLVYRALSKDVDYASEDGRASLFYRQFKSSLGIQ